MVAARPGDSLSRLASTELDDPRAWPALMLATNGRLGDGLGLAFIGDPNEVVVGQRIYVPGRSEAAKLLAGWRSYERAILDMSLPEPWEVEGDLVILPSKPIVVVTWARTGQYSEPFPERAAAPIWVTVEPHLREFCRGLAATTLVERLEQRLGMPPKSNKTTVVRIRIDPAEGGIFRPCSDPRVDRVGCSLPGDDLAPPAGFDWYPLWFYRQYHAAYGTARPTRFPWTSLGYTYDWGQDDEVGESEFVVAEGAAIQVLETVPTAVYCADEAEIDSP